MTFDEFQTKIEVKYQLFAWIDLGELRPKNHEQMSHLIREPQFAQFSPSSDMTRGIVEILDYV